LRSRFAYPHFIASGGRRHPRPNAKFLITGKIEFRQWRYRGAGLGKVQSNGTLRVVDPASVGSLNTEDQPDCHATAGAIYMFIAMAAGQMSRPQEWRAVNYAPRGHPYFGCSTTGLPETRPPLAPS
jgi:hypothetical protein